MTFGFFFQLKNDDATELLLQRDVNASLMEANAESVLGYPSRSLPYTTRVQMDKSLA